MILQCTKKAQDYFGITPIPKEDVGTPDPLFSWVANLIVLNRRKTLVVVNEASRCSFLLYGITAKQIPKIDTLILDGIRTMMESAYIATDVIQKYLADCGTILHTSTLSRSNISICNYSCERLLHYSDSFLPNDLYQKHLLSSINYDIDMRNKSYSYFHDIFYSFLRERYGDNIISCQMYELRVVLDMAGIQDLRCERTLQVPAGITFHRLHKIIQTAFAWENNHLYDFILETDKSGRPSVLVEPPTEEPYDFFDTPEVTTLNSLNTPIDSVFEKQTKITYEYDFGDAWEHTITLQRVYEVTSYPSVRCTEWIGEAPMEDCGGPEGFANILRILSDPSDPEYEDTCNWLGMKEWHSPSQELINKIYH